ncbi:MAG: biotin--[acetyl-CoA-carboxylase] ligase [Clostridia bacterium]
MKDDYIINEAVILAELKNLNILMPVKYYDCIASTNDKAKENFNETNEHCLTVAGRQSNGKGRNGRSFASNFGGAYFTMTFALNSDNYESQMFGSILTAGIAVYRVLRSYGIETLLKWPNDVLYGNKKLCGILSEVVYDGTTPDYMLVGIGINVNTSKFDGYEDVAISMKQIKDKDFSVAEIIAKVTRKFFECITDTQFDCINEFKEHSCTIGRTVLVKQLHNEYYAVAKDINSKGFLIVQTPDGLEHTVNYGDVTVKEVLN